jgi:hypothetical protein
MTQRESGNAKADPPSGAPVRHHRVVQACRPGARGSHFASTERDCLPGCAASYVDDAALGFVLCDAPVARLRDQGRRLVVSASRVTEPGEPVFVSVALSVDGAEALELAPCTARALAAALVSAADATEADTRDA